MKSRFFYLFTIFCLISFFVAPLSIFSDQNNNISLADDAVASPSPTPIPTPIPTEKIFYMSQRKEKEGIESLKTNADKIDILAPQFYAVSSELKLVGGLDEDLQKEIKETGVKVMPLITNAGFKQSVMHNLLLSAEAQDNVIESLAKEAEDQNYIGWQFDFENISYLDKDLYSSFIEKTAKYLHENGLILSVAAVTRSVDYEDTNAFKNWSGVFDYARIADAVDFISMMTYDDPNSFGPVASLPFINRILDYVKDKIPPEKLSFGIPLYHWEWSINPFKKVVASGTYAKLSYIKDNYWHVSSYDSYLGASWMSYFYQNKQYMVWLQDKQSFSNKLDVIKQNNFRGFSAWVLGIEDPGIWSAIE